MQSPFIDSVIFRLHKLIKRKRTGTPAQLAQKLSCSKRTVYRHLEKMKASDLPVIWDEASQSYCYDGAVEINFSYVLNGKEMECIRGGASSVYLLTDHYQAVTKNGTTAYDLCKMLGNII